jgi:hypothetical protein
MQMSKELVGNTLEDINSDLFATFDANDELWIVGGSWGASGSASVSGDASGDISHDSL